MRLILGMLAVVLVSGCVYVFTSPDTPGNTAIQLAVAIRVGDETEAGRLVCGAISDAPGFGFTDPDSWAQLSEFHQARLRNISEGRTAFGGDGEYSFEDERTIEEDEAWSEIEFRGTDLTEVWRLHMVRENGTWKVCGAELRS